MGEQMARNPDPKARIEWTPPLYPDTVEMQTGRDMLAEIAQLQTELQVKCSELAALEDERAVTVLELEKVRAEAVKMRDLLVEAHLQLEYLDSKFPATGTTAAVLARLEEYLNVQED